MESGDATSCKLLRKRRIRFSYTNGEGVESSRKQTVSLNSDTIRSWTTWNSDLEESAVLVYTFNREHDTSPDTFRSSGPVISTPKSSCSCGCPRYYCKF